MWENKTIKVVSNGTKEGTRVIDARTGEVIPGIQSVTWDLDIHMDLPRCTIIAIGVPIEVECEAEIATDKFRV